MAPKDKVIKVCSINIQGCFQDQNGSLVNILAGKFRFQRAGPKINSRLPPGSRQNDTRLTSGKKVSTAPV